MTSEQQDQLEALVDACSLAGVLCALGNICAEKSDHVLTNWQDRALSAAWMKAMTVCDTASSNRHVADLS